MGLGICTHQPCVKIIGDKKVDVKDLGYEISTEKEVLLRVHAVVKPMTGCETRTTQLTDMKPIKESEPWREAKVFLDCKSGRFSLKCQKLTFTFQQIELQRTDRQAFGCVDAVGQVWALDAKGSELISCMLEQYLNHLQHAPRTMRK